MFRDKRNTFSISCVVFTLVILTGCIGTIGGRAFTYKTPITDPDIYVDTYNPDKIWHDTTLLADNHRPERPRIIEVDMEGQIVWEYVLAENLRRYTNPVWKGTTIAADIPANTNPYTIRVLTMDDSLNMCFPLFT